MARARLAVDIGGTFTDLALDTGARVFTLKVLTTTRAPEEGVLDGVARILQEAGLSPSDIGLLVHGTTLATNALIERKGARTALVVTEGMRDSVEMAYENRFEQYDVNVDRPVPLVPRALRLPVRERLASDGSVLLPLDENSVHALADELREAGVESIAIGLIHAYANPTHEQRVAEILREHLPEASISLSSEVCPEIREYERQSTTCANAYVQPLMARYLTRLGERLQEDGLTCPFFLMTSGGGLASLDTAIRFPIRLVESGPAGGAILAARIATQMGLDSVLSYDMGGTTAKICLIDAMTPLKSRTFEVDRVYRFKRGSGLPVRIPVIEMVEIGAGGGSIARMDTLGRIQVGPDSAGSEPGPACYGRGGTEPTVTDADVGLGRIDPALFGQGAVRFDADAALSALAAKIGEAAGLDATHAAYGICEIVDENMANAARVHAIEWGKDIAARTMIAFGGAAPLHAARLAEKLGIDTVIVPPDAGVGSAIGFLMAPIAYEVVRSRYMRLDAFDAGDANATLDAMRAEAEEVVRLGAPDAALVETREAYMRYIGQGHEISVTLPEGPLDADAAQTMRAAFDKAYSALYGRTIPHLGIEILSWTLTLQTRLDAPEPVAPGAQGGTATKPRTTRRIFDPGLGKMVEAGVHLRSDLAPDAVIAGPALIAEAQTTSVVSAAFTARIATSGAIVMQRRTSQEDRA
ncbi:hydantoinase/oxoprolinase family protein [Saliniramus sp.]|uniref:hydantoinase/oxoprolinase family protein n=1 Tax=Saliniramus sp. TaxID=2986772 RepID=UPI002BDCDEE1|nr:hydantoinase/oxoprolinase family protein [Saliniramus sp.]HMB11965.1 hydantoinase/oxoprolinase family protein [Saliniramus sp.]